MASTYVNVPGQPHIKQNTKTLTYLVTRSIMRDGKTTSQYKGNIKSLPEAIRIRDIFVREIPAETLAETNIRTKTFSGTQDPKELNKAARFFYKRGEVSSPYYIDLEDGEKRKIRTNVSRGSTPGKFNKNTVFTPLKKSQQNKILKFFPNADFDSYKLGFDSVNDRQNFDAVDDFIERGYKPAFYNVKDLPKKTQNLIVEAFGKEAEAAGTPLEFGKGRKFGITKKENPNLNTRIVNFINNVGKTYPYAFSFEYPENWIIQQMQRASKNNPNYDVIKNQNGKIIGAIENGVEYYHRNSKVGNLITNHPEAPKISKIVDIAKKAKSSIPVSLSKMFPKGFDQSLLQGNRGYNDLLQWLDNSEGRRVVQNAIQLHHAGEGAVTGTPALAKDLQLLTAGDNKRAEVIRNQILKNDLSGIQELKDKGIRLNVEGKEYGAGFETPEAGLKRIEKQARLTLTERLKTDPELSSFNKFLQQKPVGAAGTLLESVASLKPGTKAFKTVCTITKADGGSVDACVERVAQEPEKFANKFKNLTSESGPLARIKNASINFLKSPGAKTFGIGAGVGAAIGLVKAFRNDDPTTYLSNEDQQKNMLVDMATQPVSVDIDRPAILDYQLPALGVGIAGSTALAAPSTIRASKTDLKFASRAPGVERKKPGVAKTGLRVLGRGLGVAASPALLAPLAAGDIASQIAAGDSPMDIATDPLNYLYPAFADQTPKLTRGLSPTVRKVARLGLSRAALTGLSRLGIGGFAASLGIQGLGLLDE
jgi:hypothetical protein